MCCHEKYIVGSTVVYAMDEPCAYLIKYQRIHAAENPSRNPEKNPLESPPGTTQKEAEETACAVYENRTEVCSRCRRITLWKAMFSSYLPPECGYVLWAEHHHLRFSRKRKSIIKR